MVFEQIIYVRFDSSPTTKKIKIMYDIETKEDEWNFFNLSKSELELEIMVKKQSIKGGFRTKHKEITLKKLEKALKLKEFDEFLNKLVLNNGVTEY
jgi:hypothetical protein